MKWVEKAPSCGDMIRTKVTFYYHYGIYVDDSTIIQFGLPDDINRPADLIRVLSTDIGVFLGNGELQVAEMSLAERVKRRTPEQTVEYARSKIGTGGYNIIHNNCEHFACECVFGERNSEFIEELRKNLRKKLGRSD